MDVCHKDRRMLNEYEQEVVKEILEEVDGLNSTQLTDELTLSERRRLSNKSFDRIKELAEVLLGKAYV